MADVTGPYLRGLKELTEGDFEALDAGELVLEELKRIDEESQEPFKTEANHGYGLMVADKFGMGMRQQTFVACAFAGRYFIDERKEMKMMKKLMEQLPYVLGESIQYYRRFYDYTKKSVERGTQATYNSETDDIIIKALDKKYWSPVREEFDGIPDLMLPLYGLMKEKSHSHLGAALIHEATHAFIYENTGYNKDYDKLREIEEGAALAVTEVLDVEHSLNEKGRAETGLDSEKLIQYVNLFEDGVKDLKVSEAVDRIRQGAVKAIQLTENGGEPERAVAEVAKRL